MAPIFSAVLGRLVLHASAAEIRGAVVGFIGESGAGKSTLARSLADGGHALVGDDLLPVRFAPLASSPVEHRLSPLRALFVLDRTDTNAVHCERREPLEALQGLIENGFGEHGDADAWAFQFDAYHRLAEAVPVFNLTFPDDVDELPRVRAALVALLSSDRWESSIGGSS
jgi:ATPase subunit of ABC transporter with duplicated ATPase domains